MNKKQVKDYCLSFENTFLDMPFDFETEVIRHKENNKIFILFCSPDERPSINLKCEHSEAEFLRSVYKDVIPGYHMNKTHRNTVYLDGNIPNEEIKSMINQSYELTKPKSKKQKCITQKIVNKEISDLQMCDKYGLISNLNKVHTTKLGNERIRRNLSLNMEDVVKWWIEKIEDKNSRTLLKGKNWYVTTKDYKITINASSYTIITAHKIKN